MMKRLCLVGYGSIAHFHAQIFRAEGAILHTVVGRVPETTARFASEFGFLRHTTDLDAALDEKDIDAVVIASPSQLHYEQARRALLAGKDVLVEIPLALCYKHGHDLVRLAGQQRRILMVAHSQRFISSLASLRQRVTDGSLHVHHIMCRTCNLRRSDINWTGRKRSWTDNLLWHTSCHFVDFSLWFLGVSRVQVVGQIARPDPRLGTPMDLELLLQTPADQLISVSASYNSHLTFHEYVIIGEEETLHFESGKLVGPEGVRNDPGASRAQFLELAWQAQDREFLAALGDRRQPIASGADVLPALAVLQEVEDRFMPNVKNE